MGKVFAFAGSAAVILMTAIMLGTANVYVWEYPGWAGGLVLAGFSGLFFHALVRPQNALSMPAIVVAAAIGVALAWPVSVGGDSWWPLWLILGVAIPLIAVWLLGSFGRSFRQS
jgi:hypothetical protein